MKTLPIFVKDETAPLEAVILGIATDFGGTPLLKDAYDPKSKEHIKAGTFPTNKSCVIEINTLLEVFEKYDIEVFRPKNIKDLKSLMGMKQI